MHYFCKSCVFFAAIFLAGLPFVASANDVFTTKDYVDMTTVAKYQGETSGGTTNYHQGDILQVNASGNLERVTPLNSLDRTHTASSNQDVPTEAAVVSYAVEKPGTVANGKVLTFTSDTVTDRPTAQYIKVPVATGDPSDANSPASPTGFASIWLQ
ncbi:MAG: hypothetical protein J5611_01355 [Alphaproteobacteria bacterium]|nr:hypothetical protein [Alphaproteobacteria bacterium]